jgi:thiol-disulfide isomerase/thioredoxin
MVLFRSNRFSACRYALAALALFSALPASAAPEAWNPDGLNGAPALILFWRSDCAPCRKELAMLPALVAAHPDLPIAVIALRDEKIPAGLPPTVQFSLAANADAMLASFGNVRHTLPFSAMRRADGTICATHTGLLGRDRVNQWVQSC